MLPRHVKPPSAVKEKRRAPRRRTLLTGKIVHSEGAFSLDCTIRDLSATGARIQVKRDALVPTSIFLINIRDRVAYEGVVGWKRLPEYGIAFLATHALSNLTKPELQFLKRIWLACAAS